MADYNYSLSGDFTNGIEPGCLHKTIEDYGFATPFNGITINEDLVSVMFTGSLGIGDQTDLDTIISNHDPDNCPEESDVGEVIGAAGDAYSNSLSSTSSSSPTRKLRMSITDLPEGRYRIGWYYEWAQSSNKSDFRARVQVNDSIDLMYHSQEPSEAGTDNAVPSSGFGYLNLDSGDYNIDIDYWAENNTSYIQNARLEIWRVA